MNEDNWVNKGKVLDFEEADDYKWRVVFNDGVDTVINMNATSFPTLLYKLGLMGVEVSENALLQAQQYIENWYSN